MGYVYRFIEWLLIPVAFISNLIEDLKNKFYNWGMPSKPDPLWEYYELRTPEEKYPEMFINQEKKTNFRKGSIANTIFNLLQEEAGEWVTLKKMKDDTGKEFPYIRIIINQIEKKISPQKIEASGKGSYRLIIS